ncbi:hypothetical protein H0H87_008177, partial [Tephrocybe sp. NHM501043]
MKQAEPTKNKGKGPDPCNWGKANLTGEELDPEIQQQILQTCNNERNNIPDEYETEAGQDNDEEDESEVPSTCTKLKEHLRSRKKLDKNIWQAHKEQIKSIKKKHRDKIPATTELKKQIADIVIKVLAQQSAQRNYKSKKAKGNKDLDPAGQITKDSALGIAFRNMRKGSDPSDNSESSSSDSSSSSDLPESVQGNGDSNPESDFSGNSSLSSLNKAQKSIKHRNAKKHCKNKKAKSLIKPTLPPRYNRTQDVDKFTQFITIGSAYCQYGKVKSEQQVMVLSQYLDGKAWKFYSRNMAKTPAAWTLDAFFTKLFNEIFPVNFREKQCQKLKDYGQGKHI